VVEIGKEPDRKTNDPRGGTGKTIELKRRKPPSKTYGKLSQI
jgi:hypothetical protein